MRVIQLVLGILIVLVDPSHAEQKRNANREYMLLADGMPPKPLKFGRPIVGTPAHVKYRFLSGESPSVENWYSKENCKNLQPIENEEMLNMLKEQFALATLEWSRAARVTFEYVEDDTQADVLVGFQKHAQGIAWANLKVQHSRNRNTHIIRKGIVCLNPYLEWGDKPAVQGKEYAAFIFAHEIGHILGFEHPNGVSKDSLMFSKYPQPRSSISLSLSESDVRGAQYLYGK